MPFRLADLLPRPSQSNHLHLINLTTHISSNHLWQAFWKLNIGNYTTFVSHYLILWRWYFYNRSIISESSPPIITSTLAGPAKHKQRNFTHTEVAVLPAVLQVKADPPPNPQPQLPIQESWTSIFTSILAAAYFAAHWWRQLHWWHNRTSPVPPHPGILSSSFSFPMINVAPAAVPGYCYCYGYYFQQTHPITPPRTQPPRPQASLSQLPLYPSLSIPSPICPISQYL